MSIFAVAFGLLVFQIAKAEGPSRTTRGTTDSQISIQLGGRSRAKVFISNLAMPPAKTEKDLPLDDEARKAFREMEPEERKYCLETLSRIHAESSFDDVVEILGKPDRNILNSKLNWWVKLGDRKSRVGVFFGSGKANRIVLDGGPGRFYYTYKPQKPTK